MSGPERSILITSLHSPPLHCIRALLTVNRSVEAMALHHSIRSLLDSAHPSTAVVVVISGDAAQARHIRVLHINVPIAVRRCGDDIVSARSRGLAGCCWGHHGRAAIVVVVSNCVGGGLCGWHSARDPIVVCDGPCTAWDFTLALLTNHKANSIVEIN